MRVLRVDSSGPAVSIHWDTPDRHGSTFLCADEMSAEFAVEKINEAIMSGFATVNSRRIALGLDPLDGADEGQPKSGRHDTIDRRRMASGLEPLDGADEGQPKSRAGRHDVLVAGDDPLDGPPVPEMREGTGDLTPPSTECEDVQAAAVDFCASGLRDNMEVALRAHQWSGTEGGRVCWECSVGDWDPLASMPCPGDRRWPEGEKEALEAILGIEQRADNLRLRSEVLVRLAEASATNEEILEAIDRVAEGETDIEGLLEVVRRSTTASERKWLTRIVVSSVAGPVSEDDKPKPDGWEWDRVSLVGGRDLEKPAEFASLTKKPDGTPKQVVTLRSEVRELRRIDPPVEKVSYDHSERRSVESQHRGGHPAQVVGKITPKKEEEE